ncbi:hypothetical protein Naga_100045g14 [Nannochloropsis gaditana]|uniref:Uncharacterized protein n=1 Tax=Nannochloropsis gaditana TaxID=72520 RepID=W7THK7_9STRA|nr:hypothetical protein Naga_100045g14 [Nannochloropsis gaditana]
MENKVHNNDGWLPASSRGKRRGQQKQKVSNKATFIAPSTGSRHAQGNYKQQRNAAADIGPYCSTGTPSTDGRGKKVFIPSCRASRIKQPARRKDFMRGLYPCSQSDDSSDDSLIYFSSEDDEDRTLSQVTSQLHTKCDLQDGDLLHKFADKLDVIVKLNVACPLSRTGLERLKSRGILDEEDSQEIAALVKACKGNVQGFASWKAMHAHACSYQDAYHSRIRRFLEESKGVAPVKTSSVGKVAPDALPLVEPTDLEVVYRSPSFPTPLK